MFVLADKSVDDKFNKNTETLANLLNLNIDNNEMAVLATLCKILNITDYVQFNSLIEIYYNQVDPNISNILKIEWGNSIGDKPEIIIQELNNIILAAYTRSAKIIFPHTLAVIAYIYMKVRECLAIEMPSKLNGPYYLSTGNLLNIIQNISEHDIDSLYSYSFSCEKTNNNNYFHLSCTKKKIKISTDINDIPLNRIGENVLLCVFSNSLSYAFPFVFSKYYLTNNCNNIAFICNNIPENIYDKISPNTIRFKSELSEELNISSYIYQVNTHNVLAGIEDIIKYYNICTNKEIDSVLILSLGWPAYPSKVHSISNIINNIPVFVGVFSPDIGAIDKIYNHIFSEKSFLCECSNINKSAISDDFFYLSQNLIEEDDVVSWCINNHKYKGSVLLQSRIDDAVESEMFINPIHLVSEISSNTIIIPLQEYLTLF